MATTTAAAPPAPRVYLVTVLPAQDGPAAASVVEVDTTAAAALPTLAQPVTCQDTDGYSAACDALASAMPEPDAS